MDNLSQYRGGERFDNKAKDDYSHYRSGERFVHRVTVMIEDVDSGIFSYGQMINYSDGGMLLATDTKFKPGTTLNVSLSKPVYKAAPTNYRTIVKWCKEIATDNLEHDIGVGVTYI